MLLQVKLSPLDGDGATPEGKQDSIVKRTGSICSDGTFWTPCEKVSPVHAGNAFLNDALYLFEHVGVFLINPVGQVAAVIQDLVENKRQMSRSWGTTFRKGWGVRRKGKGAGTVRHFLIQACFNLLKTHFDHRFQLFYSCLKFYVKLLPYNPKRGATIFKKTTYLSGKKGC